MLTEDKLESRRVRLFPSHNIHSEREAELRAAASFLAVAKAVSEFGRRIVSMAGGPAGKLECYTEVPFPCEMNGARKELRPDGLLRVRRGKTEWKALVEVKVGAQVLDQAQIDQYHTVASDEGIDALITVSNEAALASGLPPHVTIDGRRARRVPVIHLSWDRLLSEAQMLSSKQEVSDADQHWMLDEWILYVTDEGSRIIEAPQLGAHWGDVMRAAQAGGLRSCTLQMEDVVRCWDAYLRKFGFRLRAKLGVDVGQRLSREEKADPAVRFKRLCATAVDQGVLQGVLQIPGAAGDVAVDVILAASSVRYSVEIDAPTEGRPRTRVSWLLRQLERDSAASGDLTVKVNWQYKKYRTQASLRDALADSGRLFVDAAGLSVPTDALPKSFTLERASRLPKGKGRSSAPILEGASKGFEAFYRDVVAKLKPYIAPAPQMPDDMAKTLAAHTVAVSSPPPVEPEKLPSPEVDASKEPSPAS
ncbi:MAG TPA: hypothetical protein VFT13_02300 [Candidatus Krumholzibacteria bacterium]|nr:hypothetical protein [Candidatus Krumholzibacteria bacterium]